MRPSFPTPRRTINEEDKFYSSLMIVIYFFQFDIVFHDLMVSGSFQMTVWTLIIQGNFEDPSYSMDFNNLSLYGDNSISDGK